AQIGLGYAEGLFDMPELLVGLYEGLGFHGRVGGVAFEAVPLAIRLELRMVDVDLHITLYHQVLVVSTVVDALLGKPPTGRGFFQSREPSLTVMPVLGGPGPGVVDDKPCPVCLREYLVASI